MNRLLRSEIRCSFSTSISPSIRSSRVKKLLFVLRQFILKGYAVLGVSNYNARCIWNAFVIFASPHLVPRQRGGYKIRIRSLELDWIGLYLKVACVPNISLSIRISIIWQDVSSSFDGKGRLCPTFHVCRCDGESGIKSWIWRARASYWWRRHWKIARDGTRFE